MMSFDQRFLDLAIRLGDRGLGLTAPNPSVGCVIERDGVVLGLGRTQDAGRPHAEQVALAMAGDVTGATAYVSLEPCAHYGQTPPCANALIEAGIGRVVCPFQDPDARVSGRGFELLRRAGIELIHPKIPLPAALRPFMITRLLKRPMVTLKIASSLDGKIALANRKSQWITSEKMRKVTRILRAKYDAILVGVGTVLTDDPSLDIRAAGYEAYAPQIVVLDSALRTPPEAKIFTKSTPIFFHEDKASLPDLKARCFAVRKIEGHLDLQAVLSKLLELGYNSVLIEGGSEVAASAVKAELVDEILHVQAGSIIGADGLGAIAALQYHDMPQLNKFELHHSFIVDGDRLSAYHKERFKDSDFWP